MADERIDSLLSPNFKEELKFAEEGLENIVDLIAKANQAGKAAEGFATQAKSIKDLSKSSEQLTKEQEKQAKAAEKLAVQAQRLADVQTKELLRAQREEAKIAAELTNDYGLLSKAYNDAALRAKNYSLQLGATHPVTLQAIEDAKKMDAELKKLDAGTGKFNRNVGNYSSATNGLRNSVQQIARELPSLSNGIQVFFSAIGNNIAPAQEAFKAFNEEQKKLRAQGLPTTSAFQALAGSIFNVQTALLLVVTGLTVYGKDIVNYLSGTKKAKDATDDFSQSLSDLNEKIEFGSTSLDRASKLRIAQAKARGADEKTIKAIEQEGFEARLKQQDAFIQESIDNEVYYTGLLSKLQGGINLQTKEGVKLKEEDIQKDLEKARSQTVKLKGQKDEIDSEKELARLQVGKPDRVKKVKDLTSAFNELSQSIREFFISLNNPSKAELDSLFKEIDVSNSTVEFSIFGAHAEENANKEAARLLAVLQKHQADKLSLTEKAEKKRLELLAKAELVQQTASEIAGNLASVVNQQTRARIEAIDAEIEAINKKRDAEIDAINLAGGAEEERTKKIAAANIKAAAEQERLEKDKLQRQRRAAAFEKAITISQIISETALAVVRALGSKPYTPANIALAAATGAIGASRLAVAIATPLPSFEKGTDHAPEGWAVTDEKGAEGYLSPSGKFSVGQNKGPKLRYLERGTKVIPHEKLVNMTALYGMGMSLDHVPSFDTSRLENGIAGLKDAIKGIPVSNFNVTGDGIKQFVNAGNSSIEWINNLRKG